MFSDTVNYLIKTPLKDIISDIREYSDIKREWAEAEQNYEAAARRLTNNLGHADDAMARLSVGCKIKYVKIVRDVKTSESRPQFGEFECPGFSGRFPCKKPGCGFGARNAAYFAAREKWANLSMEKKYFWAERKLYARFK